MVDLSIIILNYNNRKFLEDCLNSIYQNTPKLNFEIIFVDNASTDDSVEFIKNKYPMLKLILNQENLGFAKANNYGIKIAQGKYILLLNTDTVVIEYALNQMVEFMETHPQVGALGPKLLNLDGSIQHQGGIFAKKFWLSKTPTPATYIIGACLMIRRKVIDKVGLLDENFFFSNEDLDWCLRIRKAGWSIYFLPQAEVVHHGGFTTKHFNPKLFVEGIKGGLYFAKKHYPALVYQAYRFLLMFFALLAIIPTFLNKEKAAAFFEIFTICIKGQIYGQNTTNK